jgi:hypothetical protein
VAAAAPEDEPVYQIDTSLVRLLSNSINDLADEDGWVFLGSLGSLLNKKYPDFDARNYGYSKLVDLMKNIREIEIDRRKSPKSNNSHVYVRVK